MGDSTTAARVLMGDSLGFHIIFVMFGLTLPILVSWFEGMAIRRNDPRLLGVAKFWSKIMTLLVITGVISGTIIALQMTLVWPGILKFGGEVIGLPFMFETYFFLIEAVFLALYMGTWGKVRPWIHWLFGLFIILGSVGSAFAITSVNGWMNLPTGFDIIGGNLSNINVAAAMFSTPALVTFAHSMPGYFLSAGLVIAGCYAVRLLRASKKDRSSKKHELDYFIISRVMIFVAIALVGSIVTADLTGKYLAAYEPEKLAAIELHHTTSTNAPFVFGGVPDANGKPTGWYIEVPGLLSFLACNSFDCEVKGLDSTPKEYQPPLYIHVLFDIKIVLVGIVSAMVVGYFVLKKWFPSVLQARSMLLLFSLFSITGIVIVELGWMLTEIGRQPWAVRGFVTTAEAVTKTHDVTSFGYVFPLSYVALFLVTFFALRKIIKAEHSKKGASL